MQLNEFKSWLEGYTLAGGKDIELIKAKLAEVYENPIRIYPPVPTWYPTPYVNPNTGWSGTSGTQLRYDTKVEATFA